MSQLTQAFLIDGSNAVYALFPSWPGSIEDQNEKANDFIERLSDWAKREPRLEIEVVFDGPSRAKPSRMGASLVRVIFSEDLSADEIIIEKIFALRYFQRKATVVTNDRALAEEARKENARVISPESLWRRVVELDD